MERHEEITEELIDLGSASTETRGGAVGKADSTDERLPISGIAED